MKKMILAAIASLLVALGATAATLDERSLFAQGHWWNPQRAGSGFEIFHAGSQAMVIWYTYSSAEQPVWYTAQGFTHALGREAWPLMKHQWLDGKKAAPTQVGTAKLTVDAHEAITFDFTLPGAAGTWKLKPYYMAGSTPEVDHSGSYFDSANSGWGITVTEQGDALGGVLYTYEPTGEPRWYAGFGRGSREVEMRVYRGPCPSCPYRASTSERVGSYRFDFQAEAGLVLRGALSVPMAQGVAIDGASLGQIGRPASRRAADRTLASFTSYASLRAYMESGTHNQRPESSGSDFSAGPPSSSSAASFSSTNLNEAGVDEMDLVKSDGRFIYAFEPSTSQSYGGTIPGRIRISEMTGATIRQAGSVVIPERPSYAKGNRGMILTQDRLVVVSGPEAYVGRSLPYYYWNAAADGPYSAIDVYDISKPDAPAALWQYEVHGTVIAARRVGNRLYLLTRFVPYIANFRYWAPAAERNAVLAQAPLERFVPQKRISWGPVTHAVEPSRIYLPPTGSQMPLSDMVVISEIDLAGPRLVNTLAIAGPIEAFYASTENLYVATGRQPLRSGTSSESLHYVTDIHQVRLAGGIAVARSGAVEGFFGVDIDKGGFRMSEHEGRLRVVTSSRTGMWGSGNTNHMTVLEPSSTAGLLKTLAYLPNARRPEPIGKPNELLYGVRFVGDRLYAVTFKKTDPLYVVNLDRPADPFIAGALEIPGYSDYLHPLGNGLLLGFGLDAVPASNSGDSQWAWFQGLHVTLFDVSDEDQPRELKRILIGKRGSTSALLQSHHAFSALQAADGSWSIGIPARLHDGAPTYGAGTPTAYYPWQESALLRFRVTGTTPATADLVQSPSLVFRRPAQNEYYDSYGDAGARDGRGILLQDGAVFVGHGQLWRQDAAGATTGPF
jgi:uncharacterized secreted protein with C-terminal beta-propeller domain